MYCFRKMHLWGSKSHAVYSNTLFLSQMERLLGDDVKNSCLALLSPRNSVGGDIVTLPFVGGWVSEWVSACVCGSVPLHLVDMVGTTVFVQSLSNFTCTFTMMRGGTILILSHGVKCQGQLWHSVYKTLWTRYRQQFLPNHFQTSHVSCG